MKYFYFHIVTDGSVMLSTLPTQLKAHAEASGGGYERYTNKTSGKEIKAIKEVGTNGYLYVCSDDRNVVKKELECYLDAVKLLQGAYSRRIEGIQSENITDFRRLKHNISTYNARSKDELESFLSKNYIQKVSRENVKSVSDTIQRQSLKAAILLLRIYTNIISIKSELTAYELMQTNRPQLDIRSHEIHKVVLISYQPYFIEFVEKNITMNYGNCYDKVMVDYSSISVMLGHIWNNAIKYARKKSKVSVEFNTIEDVVEIRVRMESLYAERDERDSLCKEGCSGKWAKKLNKAGNGIGLSLVERLTKLNNGTFAIEWGDEKTYEEDGAPYAWNTFVLKLKKAEE